MLFHKLCIHLLVFCPTVIELHFKHTHKYKVYFKYTLGDILTPKVCNFTKIIGKLFRELGLDLMTHESQFTDQF